MEMVRINFDSLMMHYAGLRITEQCFPKRVWARFFVFHSFFVFVKVVVVNINYMIYISHYDLPLVRTWGNAIGLQVLWSRHKV
jgi:hypothetical protein